MSALAITNRFIFQMRRFHQGIRNAMSAAGSTGPRDQSVAARKRATVRTVTTDRSFVAGVMKRLGVPPKELSAIIDRPARTAERYVEGSRLPDAVAFARIVRSRIGAAFVGEMVRDLSAETRREFFFGIMRAPALADGL